MTWRKKCIGVHKECPRTVTATSNIGAIPGMYRFHRSLTLRWYGWCFRHDVTPITYFCPITQSLTSYSFLYLASSVVIVHSLCQVCDITSSFLNLVPCLYFSFSVLKKAALL